MTRSIRKASRYADREYLQYFATDFLTEKLGDPIIIEEKAGKK